LYAIVSLTTVEVEGRERIWVKKKKIFFSKPSPFSLLKMVFPHAPPPPTNNETAPHTHTEGPPP